LLELLAFKKQMILLGLKPYIHIAPKTKQEYKKNKLYQRSISYQKILQLIEKSDSILDLLSNPEDGLSLRAMESLFFGKKLITNSLRIAEYDFYKSENIFIIGKDDIEHLPDFLKTPYNQNNQEIIDYYDFDNWVKRFFKTE